MRRDDILRALKELAAVLNERGVAADIYIVGGAAIAVAYDPERETKDVDAVFEPRREVREAAAPDRDQGQMIAGQKRSRRLVGLLGVDRTERGARKVTSRDCP